MNQALVTHGIPVIDQGAAHVVERRLVLVWKRLVEDALDPGLIGSPFNLVRLVRTLGVGCLVGRLSFVRDADAAPARRPIPLLITAECDLGLQSSTSAANAPRTLPS